MGSVAAFAFGDASAHCLSLTDAPQATSEHHGHQHGGMDHAAMAHEDTDHGAPASGGHDHALPDKCCGLFGVTALAPPAVGVAEIQLVEASPVTMPAAESLLGRGSSRIDRPPRSLLPL